VKLNGTHQLMFCADSHTLLGYSILSTTKNTEASLVVSKKTGLEVNAKKTRYTIMYCEQNKVK
jgi:hypothetical protein